MNQREDLYATIHKAIRTQLFSTTTRFARTDFHDDAEGRAALAAVQHLVAALRSHGHHEDRHVLPVLARLDAALTAALTRDHAEVEALHDDLAALTARAEEATLAARPALVPAIASLLHRLVARHLVHMDREEQQANAVLWANCSEEELLAIRENIVKDVPPAELMETLDLMFRAVSPAERAKLVAGITAKAPPPVAARIRTMAEVAAQAA